jgi:energy-coupling factor transporter ATP-binding protein EcfA2
VLDAEIFDLGKGQKQRLALASVLTLNPKILVIDEPTTGQDPQMTKEIFDIIKRLNEIGTTVLMITHRVDYAAAYAHRAIVMNRGEVAFDGPVLDLISNMDIMRANALEMPDITKLALQLGKHGVPPWTIRYEQLEGYIQQLVENSHGD